MIKTDTHYHIDLVKQPGVILEQGKAESIAIVAPSMHPESFKSLKKLQVQHDNIRLVACGLHPEAVHSDEEVQSALDLACTAMAIGEVGLPYYEREITARDIEILRDFSKIAAECNIPMILHAVHSQAPIALSILLEQKVQQAIFHWLKAEEKVVKNIVSAGYMISVTPEITYRDRDQRLLQWIPPSQLLLETDGPFEHGGPYKGRLTVPQMIRDAAQPVAEFYRMSLEQWWQQHEENVKKVFNLTDYK
jgi:TatD DNase family protein